MPGLLCTMARRDSKSSESEADSNKLSDQLRFVRVLRQVLCQQYFKQLKLDFTVIFTTPNNKFANNAAIVGIDIRLIKDAMALKKECRFDAFLHLMNKFTSSNRFVGLYMQSLLELILTTNTRSTQTEQTTSRLIQSASLTFENIVDNFPPTWLACSNAYKSLLFNLVDIEVDFNSIHANNSDGLFHIILALLEDVLKDKGDDRNNSQPFDSFANFQQFERSESKKCCYSKLSRDDKIERLFVVLHLLVKLMEIDLTLWNHKYPFQTRTAMSNTNTSPLIGHLLWKERDCGQMNIIIRNILKIFTTCVWIDFADDKIDILARLVNLVATAVNLYENQSHENLITYPNIKSLNETFSTEVSKSIEAFPYTIQFYLKVIKKIRSPIIRMLITNRILLKFNKVFHAISLLKIVEDLSKQVWLQYKTKEKVDEQRNNVVEYEFTNYPIYDPLEVKKSNKHLEMYQDEYLDLLFCQFESYAEVYRSHEIREMWMVPVDPANDIADEEKEKLYNQLMAKANAEKSRRFDLNKLFIDWKLLATKSRDHASVDPIYIPITKCEHLYVYPLLCTRSVEDLENIIQLKEMIDKYFIEFGNTFGKWHTLMGQYFK